MLDCHRTLKVKNPLQMPKFQLVLISKHQPEKNIRSALFLAYTCNLVLLLIKTYERQFSQKNTGSRADLMTHERNS